MAINYFTYDGTPSTDFNMYISGDATYGSPERDVEHIEIPGRNGTLTLDNGRFKNIVVSYHCYINKDFSTQIEELRSFLLSDYSYRRLEDTYHPNEYRMAKYYSSIDISSVSYMKTQGEFTLSFDCMPQRFLKSGEEEQTFSESSTITNPTRFVALPEITVYGSENGTITIGNYEMEITAIKDGMILDCTNQDAKSSDGTTNLNAYVFGKFPKIESGEQTITISGGVTSITIKPNWWIL